MPVPKPDTESLDIKEWETRPGNAVAFDYGILHGTRGDILREDWFPVIFDR